MASASNADVTWTYSNAANDPSRFLDRLTEIEAKNRRPKRDDALVKGFVTWVRAELVEEAIAEARVPMRSTGR
jgi:hypothetical protein